MEKPKTETKMSKMTNAHQNCELKT